MIDVFCGVLFSDNFDVEFVVEMFLLLSYNEVLGWYKCVDVDVIV